MAHYTASIDTPLTVGDAFSYLSDFANAAEWDPGVIEATSLTGGRPREGSEFRLVARFLGRSVPLTYRIVDFDPPHAVTLRGENSTVVSIDRITFESRAAGTRVVYEADLALKGPLRLADPLLALAFRRTGDHALAGLRAKLGAAPASAARDA